ncbi:MAG: hypothetical protein J6W08_02990 [Alphaproteobacteria bacterium]|nr:hypothetical protein [Alphaproteobacteria bacterium]
MHAQKGNFLLQALLALTLVFAFMPFFAKKLSSRDMAAQMYATTEQIETVYNATRNFLREEKEELPYKKQELSGNAMVSLLEVYGLPFGFVPQTPFGQDISLVIDKNQDGILSYIKIKGGNLSKIELAELARRVGFYANNKGTHLEVIVPIDSMYSDIVSKKETSESAGFLSELDMGDNSIDRAGVLFARNGAFESAQFNTLVLYGVETGNNERNKISDIYANRTVFQSADGGAALSLGRGELNVSDLSVRTISKYGSAGGFESNAASVYDFSMAEGKTGFSGPSDWIVRGSVRADNFSFNVDRLDIGAYLDASRGQDVYIDYDSLEYNTKMGVDVKNIYAANISLRDQTSYGLLNDQSGPLLIDIRPAGTSLLPDVYVDTIDNDSFEIIANPKDTDGKMVSCRDIIAGINGVYNRKSLAQNIICQYVFWQRLEARIDIKQCLMSGRSDCM